MADVTTRPARAFTYNDLEDMPDDGYKREIIGGTLLVTPAPFGRHQRAVLRLAAVLLGAETPEARVLPAPYDWRLQSGDSVEPDVLVIRRDDFDPDGPLPASATPLLVVEVLSPSNPDQDRLVKRALYESLGVPAYWIVAPQAPALLALRLQGGRYEVEAEVAGDECFTTGWPFSLRIVPSELVR
ncbi:MAG: Uma2 family endonuclease [Acidimicrobiales bacterium]